VQNWKCMGSRVLPCQSPPLLIRSCSPRSRMLPMTDEKMPVRRLWHDIFVMVAKGSTSGGRKRQTHRLEKSRLPARLPLSFRRNLCVDVAERSDDFVEAVRLYQRRFIVCLGRNQVRGFLYLAIPCPHSMQSNPVGAVIMRFPNGGRFWPTTICADGSRRWSAPVN
jgi:hypothetical protein